MKDRRRYRKTWRVGARSYARRSISADGLPAAQDGDKKKVGGRKVTSDSSRMTGSAVTSEPPVPLTIGVVNPFALAEVRLGRPINWQRIPNPRQLLESTLRHPYDQLFDPATGSPLYPGLKLKNGIVVQASPAVAGTASREERRTDADMPVEGGIGAADVSVGDVVWQDPGDFFEETTELLDPVQGAVADCYLIAALSSVAWARPYLIAQRNRATDDAGNFVDLIEFFDGSNPVTVEVSENLPLGTPGNYFLYCRSSDPGEIWPAVYEKAYAKWRTNDPGDQPNIPAIAFGDPVGALAQLTGFVRTYYWCDQMQPHDIWQTVRGNSLSYKTFNPMVAFTYGTSAAPR
jgi:hypothetical protein